MDAPRFVGLCNRYSVAVFLTISICQAFVWGTLDKWLGVDVLAIPWIHGDLVSIDGWSMIHVLAFAGCAAISPGQFWWFLLLGCVWEVYEFMMAGGVEFWAERGVNSAWDVWFNILGYRLGENLLAYFGEDSVQRAAQWLFWFGIVLTMIVVAVSVFRGDLSVGWTELAVLGFGVMIYRTFFHQRE